MLKFNENKSFRVLEMHKALQEGKILKKIEYAQKFGVSPKTIQRDIDDLRSFLYQSYAENEIQIKYSKSKRGFYLQNSQKTDLTSKEILAICKVLLESRGFCKDELDILIDKLISKTNKDDHIYDMILNEKFYYTEPRHSKPLIDKIFDLSKNIVDQNILEIEYLRPNNQIAKKHRIKPVSVMFSEYYFYLIAYMANKDLDFPTVFRIDRIQSFKSTKENFSIPYKDKFSDGEFRNRVLFMFSGELQVVKFLYKGSSLESVLDKFPTAEIIDENEGIYTIRVEVYGTGIDIWFRSQGDNVEIVI
ncbi:MAG: WYL domain-containing protein [Clostridia bacterium]